MQLAVTRSDYPLAIRSRRRPMGGVARCGGASIATALGLAACRDIEEWRYCLDPGDDEPAIAGGLHAEWRAHMQPGAFERSRRNRDLVIPGHTRYCDRVLAVGEVGYAATQHHGT